MHLRGLVFFTLFLLGIARRSFFIHGSHHEAQQQNHTLTKALEVSSEAREALLPRGFPKVVLPRQRPAAGTLPAARAQGPPLRVPPGVQRTPWRAQRAPPRLPRPQASVARILDTSAAGALRDGRVHQEFAFAPPRLVDDLRQDISALADAGLFWRAESEGRDGYTGTMRSALYCDPIARDRSIGVWDAFFVLWERLDEVRQELSAALDKPLLDDMEIHYVHYAQGGYYKPHLDEHVAAAEKESQGGTTRRRCVSFILYLTPHDAPWEASDGGALRVYYDGMEESGTVDYLPASGSLVLFDSTVVEHAVMPTHRERTCLIGWWHTPVKG